MPAPHSWLVCAVAALAGLLAAPAARAENLALFLRNGDYLLQPDLPRPTQGMVIERALERAGFEIVALDDRPLATALRRLDGLAERIEAAERLVIYVEGHVVRSAHGQWLLAPEAGRVGAFDIGTAAVPIEPLLALAGRNPGAALVAVADATRPADLGAALTAGFEPRDIPQGVSVLAGPPAALAGAFAALLAPGTPLAEALDGDARLRVAGYLPRTAAFLPATGAATGAGDGAAPPTREERLAAAEAALGLDRNDRRRVQQDLTSLGHDTRGIDGVFGPGTRAAIRAWQAEAGYPPTGYLTGAEVEALRNAADRLAAEAEARDTAYWRDTGRGRTEAGARAYLERYPAGLFADIAAARVAAFEAERLDRIPAEERAAWDAAVAADTAAGFDAYLAAYPDGAFADEALALRAERAATEAQAADRLEAAEAQVIGNPLTRSLVERRLADLGFEPGTVDGSFDAATRAAIARFQEDRGLPPTGHVDQPTLLRLLINR